MFGYRGRTNGRLLILAGVFAISGAVLLARVAYIQLVESSHYEAEAREEHFGQQEVRAERGAILDRNGYPLATTIDAYDVYIDRRAWQDPASALDAAEEIAGRLGTTPGKLLENVRSEPTGLYVAYRGLDFERGESLAQSEVLGLRLVRTSRRFYPEGDLASALLGFVGRDQTGLTGIEADFDRELGGTPGTIWFERDSIGNRIALGRERIGVKPVPGGDIRLTIDRYIQRIVERALEEQTAETGALGGSIVVMDPGTGEILAMSSRPSFRLSDLADDPDQSLFRNRAVTDVYEPGSVFKTLTAAMALDLGLVTPASSYDDTGVAYVGSAAIRNWDYSANGTTNVTQILQRSLNTGAVWLSQQVGAEDFYRYMREFGIGQGTGTGLSGEADGLLRSSEHPFWSPADLATNSFGQGVAATPLQVVTAIASLANGGNIMRPYIVQQVHTPDGVRMFEPVVVRNVVREETAARVAYMMNQVVEGIPGHLAAIKGYQVAGKTGTTTGATLADGAVHDGNIASFIGFAPLDDPKMIMLVKLDFKEDRLGGEVAAPVFRELAPLVLAHLGVRPEGSQLVVSTR